MLDNCFDKQGKENKFGFVGMKMKLGDVFKLSSGKSLPEKKRITGKHNVYGGNGITGNHNDYFVEETTIVIGRVGEYCGAVHLTTEKCWITDNALMVTEWYQEVDKQYLVYVLNAMNLHQYAKTVGQPSISQANIYGLDINLPLMDQQQEIVKILNLVSKIIIDRKEELNWLDDLIKARFVELFGTIHDNKFGYEIKTLQDVCEQIKDGTHQTPTYTDDSVNGYKFLSSKDVTTGKIDWTHIKYIPKELHKELYARIAPKRGDILLAKNGTTGIAAIVDRDEIFDIYVSLALLRPIEINAVYLWAAINSVETKQQFDSSLKGIGVPNLHLGEIKKAKIIVPPIKEQNQFAAFVEQTDKSKVVIQKALDEAQLLFDSLMQKHFG